MSLFRIVLWCTTLLRFSNRKRRWENGIEGMHMKLKRNQWSKSVLSLTKSFSWQKTVVVQMDLSYSKLYAKLTFTFCFFHNLARPVVTV